MEGPQASSTPLHGRNTCRHAGAGRETAADDPEGRPCTRASGSSSGERVLIIAADIRAGNALQRRGRVLQKSLREGFGLTVSEAMWKAGRDGGDVAHPAPDCPRGMRLSWWATSSRQLATSGCCSGSECAANRQAARERCATFLMTRLLEECLD